MASTFAGLSIAASGLSSSQAGLAVTSNNISNVNTTGYTRQTVNQYAVSPAAVYTGSVGGGSQVSSIGQVRELRLDQKYWRMNLAAGEWETKANSLAELESVFDEISGDGLNAIMNDFYTVLEKLSNDPSSSAARTEVKQTGLAICEYLNSLSRELNAFRSDLNGDVKTTVNSINSYAGQIAALNQQIQLAAASGADANELKDQRSLLIDQLSKLTDVEVGETLAGTQAGDANTLLTISINGNILVSGGNARTLLLDSDADSGGMVTIYWQDTNEQFTPAGGELKAYLELRDGAGSGSDYKGAVYYLDQLDIYARTFAKAFNEGLYASGESGYSGHAAGVGADGSTGVRFFSYDGKSSTELMASGADMDSVYANITAGNLSLTSDILADINKIAAASASGEAGNNENINSLISLSQDTRMFDTGAPLDFINSIVTTLGSASSYAQRLSTKSAAVLTSIETRRSSLSGVSTNEETANLTKYQQAYEASAKVMSVWNEIYQDTISMVNK